MTNEYQTSNIVLSLVRLHMFDCLRSRISIVDLSQRTNRRLRRR